MVLHFILQLTKKNSMTQKRRSVVIRIGQPLHNLRCLHSRSEAMFSFGEDASMGRGMSMILSMFHKMNCNSEGTEALLAWKLL